MQQIELPIRLRRNRKSESIRKMVQETKLSPADFVVPIFLIEGHNKREKIESMPGIERLSIDLLIQKALELYAKKIRSVVLFPVLDPELRTPCAKEALNPKGLLTRAIFRLKETLPEMCVMAEAALDPFTSHGHDGIMSENGEILNDATVHQMMKVAVVLADAGADFIAPSDMMDGRVKMIRQALDRQAHQNVGIMAYSIKYASALYGPFRTALHTKHLSADKRTYHMDPANVREAMLEAALDEEEGADIMMVKPALYYLDVIARLRMKTNRPIAAYHVSGEYSMVMAAAEKGWLDPKKTLYEALLSIKRAGADLIFTYAAEQVLDECM